MSFESEEIVVTPAEAKALAVRRRARLLGIGLMCCAVGFFAALDATNKWLNPKVGILEVSWARYTAGFVLTLMVLNPLTHPRILRTAHFKLQVLRSLLLVGSTLCVITALYYLRLDQVVTFAFAAPLFVTALSGPLLGEWAGPRRWIAIVVGFIGVLIATRPGLGGIPPQGFIIIAGMLFYVFYMLITRIVAKNDSTETSLFYTNIVGTVVLMPLLPFIWVEPASPFVILMLFAAGALGSLGHYLLIWAHKHAPPNLLAPFVYTQIVWSITLGYVIFADVPDVLTLAGAVVVVGSGLYILHRERVRGPH